jgi:hypothetical protein
MQLKKLTAALLATLATGAVADTDTTATLKGLVNIDGASVTVEYEPTGLTKTRVLGDENNFSFSFLPIGGPYTVTVSAPGYETVTTEDVYLAIYQNSNLVFNLRSAGDIEEILVYGQKEANAQGFGTGTTLDRRSIDGIPTVDRSIADYAKLDPRINVNAAVSNIQISAMGVNNRYNDFQIDGVSFNDPFGLNASGFGSLRNPISMDFIEQVSVDITPYDVSRGGATGASISVVTKSGTNDLDGSVYYTKRDEGDVGDLPNGSKFPPFEEEITAITLSGPIIKDKLFFFVGYEEFEKIAPYTYGPAGSGALNESRSATAADFERIAQIAQDVYGFNPGGFQNLSFPESAEEYVVKLDWFINDYHRVELNYAEKEEVNYNNIGLNKFSSVVYTKPPLTERMSLSYYGDLSDNLRVKARYTSYEFTEDAESAGGLFPEVAIDVGSDRIYLGGEKYRGANFISVVNDSYSLKLDYSLDSHIVTFGAEYQEGRVQNQFLARYNGEVQFNSIDDFAAGNWRSLRFQVPSAGLDALDTITADFDIEQYTFYIQDQWNVNDLLSVQYGLRWDMLETPTKPVTNTAFVDAYGFTNANAFDYDVLQPRASFEYFLSEAFEMGDWVESAYVRGGVGLFMGRFPNVWLGNAYSRPGPLSDYPNFRNYNPDIGPMPAGDPRFFWLNSPASSYTIAQPGSNSASQYVVSDFEAPSTWRSSLALDLVIFDGYELTLEYNKDVVNEALHYVDPGLVKTGTLADGRGTYSTSGSLGLANISEGGADAFTVSLRKAFLDDTLSLYAAYTNTDAEDVWNLTSSQAESNYGYQQRGDGDPRSASLSQYNVEHKFLAVLDYTAKIFGNNDTRFSLLWSHSSGEPYSVTYDANNSITGARGFYGDYDLAYIPTGADDSKVEFASAEVAADVMAYVNSSALAKYKGRIAPRNAFESPWITRMDLRITQDINLPEFLPLIGENKAIIYLDVLNLGNLIDDKDGIVKEYSFNTSAAIQVSGVSADGKAIISGVTPEQGLFTNAGEGKSSYEVRLGFKYEF